MSYVYRLPACRPVSTNVKFFVRAITAPLRIRWYFSTPKLSEDCSQFNRTALSLIVLAANAAGTVGGKLSRAALVAAPLAVATTKLNSKRPDVLGDFLRDFLVMESSLQISTITLEEILSAQYRVKFSQASDLQCLRAQSALGFMHWFFHLIRLCAETRTRDV